jgi:DNA-binding NtrC family response regulator
MKTQPTNLFIVDDDELMVTALKQHLSRKFGDGVHISTFNDGDSCLANVNKETDIVILDYFMEGKNGLEVLKSIKSINPETKVIMLSSNEDIALAVETFRAGAKDYVIKGPGSWAFIAKQVNYILTEPIRIMVREFGISKFMAIFIMVFITMGAIVSAVLYYINK